jgi:hypothetical protein
LGEGEEEGDDEGQEGEGEGDGGAKSVLAVGEPVTPYVESMLDENVFGAEFTRLSTRAKACIGE